MRWLTILTVVVVVVGNVEKTKALNLSRSLGEFAISLFANINPNSQTDYILSPLSVLTDLGMAVLGACGQTATEMESALGLVASRQSIGMAFRRMLQSFRDAYSVLNVVNKIYVNEYYPIKPDYNTLVNKDFFAVAESLDFGQPAAAALTINTYVAAQTNNKITNLVDPSTLSNATRVLLINAVYFKAAWKYPFQVSATDMQTFYLDGGVGSVQLAFMHITKSFGYVDLPKLKASIVSLPFQGGTYSFNVILPYQQSSLSGLLNSLRGKDLSRLDTGLQQTVINLSMPKFEIRFSTSLKAALQQLGIRTAFTDDANFGYLLNSPAAISDVVHQAYINVDEAGTEAAAATSIGISTSAIQEPDLTLVINRPFWFYIKDSGNHIIFSGQKAT